MKTGQSLAEKTIRTICRLAVRIFGFDFKTLRHGKSAGVQVLSVDCDALNIQLVPTRGMGISDVHFNGTRFGWDSPIAGPVHPNWVPIDEPSGLGWLDGFDEMMARCGLVSNGAPQFDEQGKLEFGLHGRVANLPTQGLEIRLDQDKGHIVVESIIEESRFHFHRLQMTSRYEFNLGSNTLKLTDTIQNLGARPANLQMLYHWNFGPPLLEKAPSCLHLSKHSALATKMRNAASIRGINTRQPAKALKSKSILPNCNRTTHIEPKSCWQIRMRPWESLFNLRLLSFPVLLFGKIQLPKRTVMLPASNPESTFPTRRNLNRKRGARFA